MIGKNYRTYGKRPFTVVVVHGGPGAVGAMSCVAENLSRRFGVIEPILDSHSIDGQVEQLHSAVRNASPGLRVKLVGHSWGAWLAYIFTSRFGKMVGKLILLGAGAFEEKYSGNVTASRLARLPEGERIELLRLMEKFGGAGDGNVSPKALKRFGELMDRSDSFEPVPAGSLSYEFRPEVYRSVWPEAERLRANGTLLKLGKNIACPVVAIHGDRDPHPADGVRVPLSRILPDFRLILIEKCGHYPWIERHARDNFFTILRDELS